MLQLKMFAMVMLTADIDISDRLINGKTDAVKSIQIQRGIAIKCFEINLMTEKQD